MNSTHPSFRLLEIALTGAQVVPAGLKFAEGLNVLSGASDTGKSYVFDAIAYCLGRTASMKGIPEAIGYEHAVLSILVRGGASWTLRRAFTGGKIELYQGMASEGDISGLGSPVMLGEKHSQKNAKNVSSFLLGLFEAAGRRIRVNELGKTESLTFPSFRQLVMVDEERIITKKSPFSSGERGDETRYRSLMRFILTGSDDALIASGELPAIQKARTSGRAEVLEEMILEVEKELTVVVEADPGQVAREIEEIEERLAVVSGHMEEIETERQVCWYELQNKRARSLQVIELVDRFGLLHAHYSSDIARLSATIEAAGVLSAMPESPCFLCGRTGSDSPEASQENPEQIVKGWNSEMGKIQTLQTGLEETIAILRDERDALNVLMSSLESRIHALNQYLADEIRPSQASFVMRITELVRLRLELERRNLLQNQLLNLQARWLSHGSEDEAGAAESYEKHAPFQVLNQLVAQIEGLLRKWDFPGLASVLYNHRLDDIVINGKDRGSYGKGYRAIAYAACTIGLMLHAQSQTCRHPGFVILDSPLNPYRGEIDDDGAVSSSVKRKFLESLANMLGDRQVLIIENEIPLEADLSKANHVEFTRSLSKGRYGLFPLS